MTRAEKMKDLSVTHIAKTREIVTLAECPPGLFRFGDALGFKTEYGTMRAVPPFEVPGDQLRWTVSNFPDAYIVESGEYFWGGTGTHKDRAALMVEPLDCAALARPEAVEDGLVGELRALLEKATPGPWSRAEHPHSGHSLVADASSVVVADCGNGTCLTPEQEDTNAALIVFLRNNAERLLSRITKARVAEGWQDIATAPETGEWLGGWWFRREFFTQVCKRRSDGKIIMARSLHRMDPSVWRPLPAPPSLGLTSPDRGE